MESFEEKIVFNSYHFVVRNGTDEKRNGNEFHEFFLL